MIKQRVITAKERNSEWFLRAMHTNLSAGSFAVGDRLPPIRELAAQFGVTRETVRRSLARLADEGYLVMRQGSGTYIQALPGDSSANKMMGEIRVLLPQNSASLMYRPELFAAIEHRPGQAFRFSIYTRRESLVNGGLSNCAGLIVAAPDRDDILKLRKIVGETLPIVALSRKYVDAPASVVLEDNFNAAYDLSEWLLRQGHARIAFVGDTDERPKTFLNARRHGWQAALEAAGADPSAQPQLWISARSDVSHFAELSAGLLRGGFDAVFCSMGIFVEDLLRCSVLHKLALGSRRALAAIDTNAGNPDVACAVHDLETMIQTAVNLIRLGPTTPPQTRYVPMRLSFPKS